MKFSSKTRTLRGQITPVSGKGEKNIIVDDLRINHGLVIESFVVWPVYLTAATNMVANAILSYSALDNAFEIMDAGDNTQFAWYAYNQYVTPGTPPAANIITPFSSFEHLDPNHIVNRDMFISMRTSSNVAHNYMIICREVQLSDDEAIITIIKENSQDVK